MSPVRINDLHGALKSGVLVKLAVLDLLRRKRISRRGKNLLLTPLGVKEGRQLIRSHWLWEPYLCDQLSVCAEDVHLQAHQLEHYTDLNIILILIFDFEGHYNLQTSPIMIEVFFLNQVHAPISFS